MSQTPTPPNFGNALSEMDAGIVLRKLSTIMGDVALGVIEHNKPGKIQLTIDLKRIGESSQVNASHKINYVKPTLRGKATEEDTTETPMHVSRSGNLSVAPEMQLDMFKPKTMENA